MRVGVCMDCHRVIKCCDCVMIVSGLCIMFMCVSCDDGTIPEAIDIP